MLNGGVMYNFFFPHGTFLSGRVRLVFGIPVHT